MIMKNVYNDADQHHYLIIGGSLCVCYADGVRCLLVCYDVLWCAMMCYWQRFVAVPVHAPYRTRFRPICPPLSRTLAACLKSAKWYPPIAAAENGVRSPLNSPALNLRIRPSLLAQFMNKSKWSNSSDHYSAPTAATDSSPTILHIVACARLFGAVVCICCVRSLSSFAVCIRCTFGAAPTDASTSVNCRAASYVVHTERIINFVSKHTHRTVRRMPRGCASWWVWLAMSSYDLCDSGSWQLDPCQSDGRQDSGSHYFLLIFGICCFLSDSND